MDVVAFVQALDQGIVWEAIPRPSLGVLRNVSLTIEDVSDWLSGLMIQWLMTEHHFPPFCLQVLKRGLVSPEDKLTEPFVAACVSSYIRSDAGLFLSNSMPVRDVDMFTSRTGLVDNGACLTDLSRVAINRGASGIDGILSSACGYAMGLHRPVTLLVGDMAFLHDLGALHDLSAVEQPMTIVVVNNGGGGIFSFLPIAKHGEAVFKCLETPHARQFKDVCRSFDLKHQVATTPKDFLKAFLEAQHSGTHTVIEAVTDRFTNVSVHRSLSESLQTRQLGYLTGLIRFEWIRTGSTPGNDSKPVLLLLHGFLGSKEDWAPTLPYLGNHFDCLAVDLPGHGLTSVQDDEPLAYSMPLVAQALVGLLDSQGIQKFAVAGYSMGGRLACYLAKNFPNRCLAMVAVSSSPVSSLFVRFMTGKVCPR